MGVLDEHRRIKQADLLPDLESDLLELAPKPTDAATQPVFAFTTTETKTNQEATGKRIEDLTLNLIREMQVMGNSDARVIV